MICSLRRGEGGQRPSKCQFRSMSKTCCQSLRSLSQTTNVKLEPSTGELTSRSVNEKKLSQLSGLCSLQPLNTTYWMGTKPVGKSRLFCRLLKKRNTKTIQSFLTTPYDQQKTAVYWLSGWMSDLLGGSPYFQLGLSRHWISGFQLRIPPVYLSMFNIKMYLICS